MGGGQFCGRKIAPSEAITQFEKEQKDMKKLCITAAKAVGFFVGWAVLTGLLPLPETENAAIWRFWAELIPFLSAAGGTVLFWLPEKRKLRLHLIASPLKSTLIGLGAGFLWLGSTAAVLLLSGTMRFAGRNEIPMLWLWIVSVFINSAMQELLVRGYLYQMLKANYHTAAAAAATTALFTFLHAGAFEAGLVPVLNVVTMSLLMTAVLEYTQSLLAPTLMHFIWNSIGSVILGGVALAEDYPHLYRTEFTGNVLLSGGAPKMEGSLVVLIVNLLLIAVFGILLGKKTHEHPAI